MSGPKKDFMVDPTHGDEKLAEIAVGFRVQRPQREPPPRPPPIPVIEKTKPEPEPIPPPLCMLPRPAGA